MNIYATSIRLTKDHFSMAMLAELANLRIAIVMQAAAIQQQLKPPPFKNSSLPSYLSIRTNLHLVCSHIKLGDLVDGTEFLERVWFITDSIFSKMRFPKEELDVRVLTQKISSFAHLFSPEIELFKVAIAKLINDSIEEKENRNRISSICKKDSCERVVRVERLARKDLASSICFKNGLSPIYYLVWKSQKPRANL
jgi:hypothetical protein